MASVYRMIYNEIKNLIPSTYATTFNYVDETSIVNGKTVPTTKTTAVYFKSAIDGKRVVNDGQFTVEYARITFNIFADRSASAVDECMEYCEAIKEALNTTFNKQIIDSESGISINILGLLLTGNINSLGRNGQGVPVFSINYTITYSKVR